MIATTHNTRGACEGCGLFRSYVMAGGFNPDGTFRMLCAACERVERWTHQRRLFEGLPIAAAPVVVEVPEVVLIDLRQMALF